MKVPLIKTGKLMVKRLKAQGIMLTVGAVLSLPLLTSSGCVSGQQRGTLHLTVTERGTGLPVKSAMVKVHPINDPQKLMKTAKTDDQGRVKFKLPQAAYSFEVEKTGFMQNEEDTNKLVQDFVNYATIQMEQLVELRGFVTEPDGSPAENIQISLENLQTNAMPITNSTMMDGSYVIKNIPAGRYDIMFSSFSSSAKPSDVRYQKAVPNKLLQGQQFELNVQLDRVIEESSFSKDAPDIIIQPGGSAPGID